MLGTMIMICIALLGILETILCFIRSRFAGKLLVCFEEDGDKPYFFLELNDGPDKIVRKKYVVLRVKTRSRQ